MKYCMVMFISFLGLLLHAQEQEVKDLAYLSDIMINATKPAHRVRASKEFLPAFKSLLNEPQAFNLDLSSIEGISEQKAPNGDFRLFTWQIIEGTNDFKYYGFILNNDGTLIELNDNKEDVQDIEYMTLGTDNWYGVLYYEMKAYEYNGDTFYLLFGYDGHSQYDKIKIAEVMQIKDGQPSFGMENFKIPQEGIKDKVKNRILLKYSADSNVGLRFNENLNIIMHDHLITRMGQFPGQGPTAVSDGSYEGYELVDGYWVYNEKVFDFILNDGEAPRPAPVLGKEAQPELKKKKTRPKKSN